jgi:hypothetical protein
MSTSEEGHTMVANRCLLVAAYNTLDSVETIPLQSRPDARSWPEMISLGQGDEYERLVIGSAVLSMTRERKFGLRSALEVCGVMLSTGPIEVLSVDSVRAGPHISVDILIHATHHRATGRTSCAVPGDGNHIGPNFQYLNVKATALVALSRDVSGRRNRWCQYKQRDDCCGLT